MYQTVVYRGIYTDRNGWDIKHKPIFESGISEDPTQVMTEFDFYEPTHPNWFATMRTIENGKITEEEWFDSSVIDVENY